MREVQEKVHRFIKETGEGYWEPLAMFAALVEEVGELGRHINAAEGVKGSEENAMEGIREELGDVLFALACIANHYGVDLQEECLRTVEKYRRRIL